MAHNHQNEDDYAGSIWLAQHKGKAQPKRCVKIDQDRQDFEFMRKRRQVGGKQVSLLELAADDRQDSLGSFIESLNARERELIELKFVHNNSLQSIAKSIGVSKEVAQRLLNRAIRKILYAILHKELTCSLLDSERRQQELAACLDFITGAKP